MDTNFLSLENVSKVVEWAHVQQRALLTRAGLSNCVNVVWLHTGLQIVSSFKFYFDSYSFVKPKQLHAFLGTLIFIQVYVWPRLLEFLCFTFMVEEFCGAMLGF